MFTCLFRFFFLGRLCFCFAIREAFVHRFLSIREDGAYSPCFYNMIPLAQAKTVDNLHILHILHLKHLSLGSNIPSPAFQ